MSKRRWKIGALVEARNAIDGKRGQGIILDGPDLRRPGPGMKIQEVFTVQWFINPEFTNWNDMSRRVVTVCTKHQIRVISDA